MGVVKQAAAPKDKEAKPKKAKSASKKKAAVYRALPAVSFYCFLLAQPSFAGWRCPYAWVDGFICAATRVEGLKTQLFW